MVNVTGKELKKALKNDGWKIEKGKGSHVNCYKNNVKLNFQGDSGKYLGQKTFDIAKRKVEEADGLEFNGDKQFEQWIHDNS